MRGSARALLAAVALAALAALGTPLVPERAFAGTVEGSVSLGPADLAIRDRSKPNPYVGQLNASAKAAAAAASVDSSYGVAWIEGAAPGAGAPEQPARMDQLGQRFVPRILAVVAGQTVEFHNSDNVFHDVFSYSPPKKFDLGRYPKGKSRSVTFAKAGAVQVYCDIHSDMRADIIVTPSRLFGMVGPSGRFHIDGVPPGSHTVKVWLPSGERSATIEVPQQGAALLPNLAP